MKWIVGLAAAGVTGSAHQCYRPDLRGGKCGICNDATQPTQYGTTICRNDRGWCYANTRDCCDMPAMRALHGASECMIRSGHGLDLCDDAVASQHSTTNRACRKKCRKLFRKNVDATRDQEWGKSCHLESYETVSDRVRPTGTCFNNWQYGTLWLADAESDEVRLGIKTPALCQSLCQQRADCAGFKWVPEVTVGRFPEPSMCSLKNTKLVQDALNPDKCPPKILELCESKSLKCLSCDQKYMCAWPSKRQISGWKYCSETPDACSIESLNLPLTKTEPITTTATIAISTEPSASTTASPPATTTTTGLKTIISETTTALTTSNVTPPPSPTTTTTNPRNTTTAAIKTSAATPQSTTTGVSRPSTTRSASSRSPHTTNSQPSTTATQSTNPTMTSKTSATSTVLSAATITSSPITTTTTIALTGTEIPTASKTPTIAPTTLRIKTTTAEVPSSIIGRQIAARIGRIGLPPPQSLIEAENPDAEWIGEEARPDWSQRAIEDLGYTEGPYAGVDAEWIDEVPTFSESGRRTYEGEEFVEDTEPLSAEYRDKEQISEDEMPIWQ